MTDESVFNVSDIVRAAFSLVRKAPTKPQNGFSKPHPYEAFAKTGRGLEATGRRF